MLLRYFIAIYLRQLSVFLVLVCCREYSGMTGFARLQVSESGAVIVLFVVCITTRTSHCRCGFSFICCGFSNHRWYRRLHHRTCIESYLSSWNCHGYLYHVYAYIVCNSVYVNGMCIILYHCVSTCIYVISGWHVGMLCYIFVAGSGWAFNDWNRMERSKRSKPGILESCGSCWKLNFIEYQRQMLT